MTWIDDRLSGREHERVRRLSIEQSAERIYGELWEAIKKCVDEASRKGFGLETNGSPHERTVVLSTNSSRRTLSTRKLALALKKASQRILVTGIEPAPELVLDLCHDNVVCLKLNGKQVSYDEAAQAVLDPFLFPPPSEEAETDGTISFG
jgi:hypothetical protein